MLKYIYLLRNVAERNKLAYSLLQYKYIMLLNTKFLSDLLLENVLKDVGLQSFPGSYVHQNTASRSINGDYLK